jgi:hypothetical protein
MYLSYDNLPVKSEMETMVPVSEATVNLNVIRDQVLWKSGAKQVSVTMRELISSLSVPTHYDLSQKAMLQPFQNKYFDIHVSNISSYFLTLEMKLTVPDSRLRCFCRYTV